MRFFLKLGRVLSVAFGLSILATSAIGGAIAFDDAWEEQGFLRLWSNDYTLRGARLDVVSDGTVSLIYRAMPRDLWQSHQASWRWSVSQGVIPTDLTQKGGDDRNLAIYFVFVDRASADKLSQKSPRRLLRNPNTRALVYVWGGDYQPGQVLESPYGTGILKTIIARPSAPGSFMEKVDLRADFLRAFGQEQGVLVGIGVTADSDDTDGMIIGSISDLTLK